MNSIEFIGKKLLVLGGAYQHSKLVEAAHELGVVVYVIDYLPLEKSPAKLIADYHFEIDIYDIDCIVELCEKEKIDGVAAAYLDPCQIPYMKVCERMGYHCLGNESQYKLLTNKAAFKRFCVENNVDIIPTYEESKFMGNEYYRFPDVFPVLVKPSDSRGSRGQVICYNKNEVLEAIDFARSYSSDKKVIVEKYMGQSNDLQLAYIVLKGEPHLLRVEDRFLGTEQDGLDKLCIATVTPSICEKDYMMYANPLVTKMIKKMGLFNSLVFIQGFMDGDRCRFYDPGLRLPGNDYDKIYKAITNIDIPQAIVKFALCGEFDLDDKNYVLSSSLNKIGSMLFPDVRPGVIQKIIGVDELRKHPNIISVNMLYTEGDQIEESYNVKQRLCEIDILCDTIGELKEIILWIQKH